MQYAIAALVLLIVGFLAGWHYTGKRADARVTELQREAAELVERTEQRVQQIEEENARARARWEIDSLQLATEAATARLVRQQQAARTRRLEEEADSLRNVFEQTPTLAACNEALNACTRATASLREEVRLITIELGLDQDLRAALHRELTRERQRGDAILGAYDSVRVAFNVQGQALEQQIRITHAQRWQGRLEGAAVVGIILGTVYLVR